ncbi:MAG: hypothetical protein QM775_31005 [Pirellulales bacterium]
MNVVIVSNLQDPDAAAEDTALVRLLGEHISTIVVDLFDDAVFNFDRDCFFLIRNVWGREGLRKRVEDLYVWFAQQGIPYLNDADGKGDRMGKRYLVELYEKHFPVIPSFCTPETAQRFNAKSYLAKPLFGGSGKGILEISAEKLWTIDWEKYILQPKLEFSAEYSFFYVDDFFSHALRTRTSRWDLEFYAPMNVS